MREPLSKRRLKAWIRMLGTVRATENHLRGFLRDGHATTLPRFDVMAALWRRREGVTMGDLSRMLLVSGGNATAIVARLEADGLCLRTPSDRDRRTVYVTLTERGVATFERQAREHEHTISALFGSISEADLDALTDILKRLRPKVPA